MKRFSLVLVIIALFALPFTGCMQSQMKNLQEQYEKSRVKVLSQTSNVLVLEVIGTSKTDAKIRAEQEGNKIFGKFAKIEENESTQEYSRTETYNGNSGYGSGSTYWRCIFTITK